MPLLMLRKRLLTPSETFALTVASLSKYIKRKLVTRLVSLSDVP